MPYASVIVTVLLAVTLQWVIARIYAGLIVELFGGTLTPHPAGALETPISYTLTAIAGAATALYCQRQFAPSRVVVVLHLIAVIIPLQSLIVVQFDFARPEFAAVVTFAFLGALLVAGSTPELRIAHPGKSTRFVLIAAAGLLAAYVYGALITHGGLGRLSFDLRQVYEVREEFLEGLAPLMGYFVPWEGLVVNPALMLAAVRRRSLMLGASALILQTLLYGMTGFRAFLLMPGLLLGVYLIGERRHLAALALIGVMLMVGAALEVYVWFDAPAVPALLVDRVMIIPAEIHYWYYDFFGVHGHAKLQLSQSIFARVAEAHYSVPIAEVIAWKYMGVAAWANVGLFADAFANFGFTGCAVFALLFALVLKILDAASRNTDARVAAALIAIQAFQLVNAGLLTTLLTHGLAVAILILWAFPMPRSKRTAT